MKVVIEIPADEVARILVAKFSPIVGISESTGTFGLDWVRDDKGHLISVKIELAGTP